jgi:hypothetical protein
VTVLYSAARLPLRFPQPEGISREIKPRTLSTPPPPLLLGDGRPGDRCFAARPVAFLHRHGGRSGGPCCRWFASSSLLGPAAGVDGPSERSRPVLAAGVCAELCLFSRAGVRSAGKSFHAGDSARLRGGAAQSQPQLHRASSHLRGGLRRVFGDCPPLGPVDHLFSVELFASTTGERRVRMAVWAGGCILQLRQARAQQYIPAILASSNKGWQRRWFYLQNDDGRLPSFSQRVVTAAGGNWRYGAPRETEESPAPFEGLGGAAIRRAHQRGGGCRHSSPEGATLDGAAAATLGDDARGRLGGFADVLGPPSRR